MALLGKYAGKVLTYDFIIKELWGPRASGDNQILRVNMANIRRKIEKNPAEPEYLFTEMGGGYRMAEGSGSAPPSAQAHEELPTGLLHALFMHRSSKVSAFLIRPSFS